MARDDDDGETVEFEAAGSDIGGDGERTGAWQGKGGWWRDGGHVKSENMAEGTRRNSDLKMEGEGAEKRETDKKARGSKTREGGRRA